jgi:hypothetical protein
MPNISAPTEPDIGRTSNPFFAIALASPTLANRMRTGRKSSTAGHGLPTTPNRVKPCPTA